MTTGTVIELRNLPPGLDSYAKELGVDQSKVDTADLFSQWLLDWIRKYFNDVQIVIDVGSDLGVKNRDYFACIQSQEKIKSIAGEELGEVQKEGSLIKVVELHPRFSVCILETYHYEDHLGTIPKILEQFADEDGNINVDEHLDVIGPIVVGQQVVAVPQEEKAGRDAIEEQYDNTISDATSTEEKPVYYREMVRKADDFLLNYGQGYFAPDALYQKGYALFQLGKYQDAIETFDHFLERYPFHLSAAGARGWVDKASQLLKEERAVTRKEKPTKNSNPWISGSFYLAAFAVVMALLLVGANTIPLWALPVIVIGALLALSIIGAFQLKQDERLSEKNFLELMVLTFKRLPLLTRGTGKSDDEPD